MNQLAVHPQACGREIYFIIMDDSVGGDLGENSSSPPPLCSLDTTDDASSSSPTPCSSNGPLPIRRGGLSQYYNGKSESFDSLSAVTSVQDLPKKRKGCKSDLDAYKSYTSPTPNITKKSSPSSSSQNRSFVSSKRSKPPLVPVKENHP